MTESIAALYRDYLHPMTPGPMIRDLVEASFHPEVQAPRLAEIIESNPLYANYLQKLDILQEKIKQWREDFPEDQGTERLTRFIVVLLGPSAIRNAILSIWISRHGAQELPRKEGVPFLIMPRTQLRYALLISDYCDEHQIANADMAYLGALCFDWVSALLEKKGGVAKSEKKYLEEVWAEALKTARIAYELASVPERMALSGFIYPAVFLTYLGKVLMAASFPKRNDGGMAWKDFVKHCESHGERSALAYRILERQKFTCTHAEVASLLSLVFPQLCPAENAIRYYAEAQTLQSSDPDSYELALLISVAAVLAKKGKVGLNTAQKEALNKFGITDAVLAAVLGRVSGRGKK